MSAATLDRQHAHAVEVAVEAQVVLSDVSNLDAREDAARDRARTFLGGALDALKTAEVLDDLEDKERARALALVNELAGLLDYAKRPSA